MMNYEEALQPANTGIVFSDAVVHRPILTVEPDLLPAGRITFHYKGIDTPLTKIGVALAFIGLFLAAVLWIMR